MAKQERERKKNHIRTNDDQAKPINISHSDHCAADMRSKRLQKVSMKNLSKEILKVKTRTR